jgi:uncharacterized protein (DUF1800 family)
VFFLQFDPADVVNRALARSRIQPFELTIPSPSRRMNPPRPVCALIAAFLALASIPLGAQSPSLSNLSTRAQIGTGTNILIAGLTIGPGGSKTVLLRAAGPTLGGAPFNVPGVLADPRLEVFSGPNKIAENDNWSTPFGGATPVTPTTFSSVGAFAFGANSRDSALLVTLAPGSYTVQVSGVNDTTGVAIVEAYEASAGGGKLVNLSARAQVGTSSNILIPGIVISPGSGTRRLLIRAAGPTLGDLGVGGSLSDPQILVTNAAGTPAFSLGNDNWATPAGAAALPREVLSAAFAQAGAFSFAPTSRDSAVMVDLPPGSYTIQTSGVSNTTGVGLVEVYDLTPATPPVVTVTATRPATDESGARPGEFTFTRTGDTLTALIVRYGVGGSAINGFDYPVLGGTVTIPAGAASTAITLLPNPDVQNEGIDTVTLTVATALGYTVGPQNSATITIADSPATLYVAALRPESSAPASTSSGTATILVSESGRLASINVTFSNLSSAQVSAHLRISPTGDYLIGLPSGQVSGAQWTFTPVGPYSSADLLNALKSGNVYVGIDTANYPQGEVRGAFVQGAGTRVFTPPAPPPAVSLGNATAVDAARFLTQTTFGPTRAEIIALTGQNLDAWITAQQALPFTSHRAAIIDDRTRYGGSPSTTNFNAIHPPNRQAAWWKVSLTAPDQLRQRVAFALSQIFVVSDVSLGDDNRSEPLAHYYDLLGNGAFGNFRTLLEQVTLNPMMAEYLSSLRNNKADPATGTTPDENYAREIMQLFTIGLNQLQPDGTLMLGNDGLPIPTYSQRTITEMAKVFTGWAYPSASLTLNSFRTSSRNYIAPLQLFPIAHDDTAKDLSPVLASPIPAAQGGQRDLQLALDALFTHASTPPFIARRLIQRLVTSNPSPAYVYRVAQKFVDDGTGTRGNLGAVVRAILTDYEARSPVVAANPTFGKLKEPILRLTGFLRTFNAKADTGRYSGHFVTLNGAPITSTTTYNTSLPAPVTISSGTNVTNIQNSLAQAALRAPTVFNFFSPDYVLPGAIAAAGLVAPEFEVTDDTYATLVPNSLRTFIFASNVPAANASATQIQQASATLMPDYAYEQSLAGNVPALLDHLSLVLAGGSLSADARTRITAGLAALPANTSTLDRVRSAVLLVMTSPNASVQR